MMSFSIRTSWYIEIIAAVALKIDPRIALDHICDTDVANFTIPATNSLLGMTKSPPVVIGRVGPCSCNDFLILSATFLAALLLMAR